MAIVLPMTYAGGDLTATTLCEDAVNAFIATGLPELMACISEDAACHFVQAEGMLDGYVPHRKEFETAAFPGTRGTPHLPNTVALLVVFYADPVDLPGGARMRVAKTFIPCIAHDDFDGDVFVTTLLDAAQTWADVVQGGIPGIATPSASWFRVLNAPPRTGPGSAMRVLGQEPRGYPGTQRRRMVPH
jgi:hypothetical protein